MDLIRITQDNIDSENICCANSAGSKDCQVLSKKKWLRERLSEGLVFLKGDVRGKCFIEYIPVENAWVPVEAENYMFINCFWVSGQLKGHGYADQLLESCICDSKEKGKLGICVLSSARKKSFLSDPGYLKYKGFQVADEAEPYFELLYLPFEDFAPKPRFKPQVKTPHIEEEGYVLYYTHQCPFTAKYVPLIEEAAKENNIPFKSILLDACGKVKDAPAVMTNYALFYDGKYVTNEILSVKKFLQMSL